MKPVVISDVGSEVRRTSEALGLTLATSDGPLEVTVPLDVARRLVAILEMAADDVHRLRAQHGLPPGVAVVPAGLREAVTCMASSLPDGRVSLEFRHAEGPSTPVLLSRRGVTELGKSLARIAEARPGGWPDA